MRVGGQSEETVGVGLVAGQLCVSVVVDILLLKRLLSDNEGKTQSFPKL